MQFEFFPEKQAWNLEILKLNNHTLSPARRDGMDFNIVNVRFIFLVDKNSIR